MRWNIAVPIALILLLSTITSTAIIGSEGFSDETQFHAAKDASCPSTNLNSLPPMVNLSDQSCLQVSLGSLTPGSLVSIDVSVSGNSADILIFAANSVATYLNDQSYRNPSIWEEDASVESLLGDAEWHWQVPTDRQETIWYLILDNLAHSGDGGEGGQGGAESNITISTTFPTMSHWTLMDSLQVLPPGSHLALLGPQDLTLDEGTQISITALPLLGVADIFILTESQKETYLLGGGGSFWVPGTQMLSITSPITQPWIVPSDLAGQPLYLFLDNEAGPTGGGDGSGDLKVTVAVTLMPVLNPVISSNGNLQSTDVGEEIDFNVNSTPNLSNQADLSQTEWDFDGDGITDSVGASVSTSYSSPGTYTVHSTIHGPDGRTKNSSIPVIIADSTNPTASILGSNVRQRDVYSNFTLTSTSTDNWQIVREDWRVDGVLISSVTSPQSTFTHAINNTGNHTIELTVTDGANNIDATSIIIVVRDGSKPVVGDIVGESKVMEGESLSFSVTASDPESTTLLYSWDFDKEVDSDEDGITSNDAQQVGSSVSWTFTSAKPTYITCTVTNDANLSRTVQFLVDVEPDPTKSSSSSSSFNVFLPLVILVVIAILGGGGWFTWNLRNKKLEAEALALQQVAAEAEANQPEPERDEQLSMYAPAGSQSGYGGYGGGDSIAALAGVNYTQTATSSDALAAFVDDDSEDEVKDTTSDKEILDDLDFLKRSKKEIEKPSSTTEEPVTEANVESKGKVAKRSSGVALPDYIGQSTQPKEKASEQQPEPVESISEPQSDIKTVKASCPACEQLFAVDLPNGVDEVLVACPKCEQKIRLQR